MGGAGGHMWHPFDCPDVNSGQDLISFFQRSIESIKRNPAALKIDGVNLSFRLRENRGAPSGFEFVIDRGSMKPLDVEGVTSDNADQRFVTKDGSPHGMVEATRILLGIFNSAIPDILPELEAIGMSSPANTRYDEAASTGGHFGLYFNTEFVLKKINVKEYPFNFIAIHGVNKFVPKGPKSRKGVAVKADQAVLDQIKDKVQAYANDSDFRVYTSIPTTFNNAVLLEDALNEQFTVVYKSFSQDPEEPGELGAGEGSTKPIKVWLADVTDNPVDKKVNISQKMREIYSSMGRTQTPYAKNIYLEVLKGTAVSDIAEGPEDIEPIVDAVVVMHATRMLGNAVLDALESDEFGSAREQEGVVVSDPEICGGTSFKFTGDFIVGGLIGSAFNEAKYRKGKLLKEFLTEEEKSEYVILIPGGFKPPTGGHYHMIKHYDKRSDVRKILVVTGPKEREGVTLEQSKQIFNAYGGFSDKVDFIISSDPTPLTTCYELVKNADFVNQFPKAVFSIGAGDKGKDPDRIKQFAKYFLEREGLAEVSVGMYPPAKSHEVDGQPASASRMRKAYREGNWEVFKKLLPDDNYYDDVVQILNNQEGNRVNENFLLAVPQSFLVEKKLTQAEKEKREQVAQAIAKDDPKMPMGKKMAIATDVAKKTADGLLSEQEGLLRKKVKLMLSNVIARMQELMDDSKIEALVDTITSQLTVAAQEQEAEKEETPEIDDISSIGDTEQEPEGMVSEMSAMAGGAVQGYAGNAFIGEYEDE